MAATSSRNRRQAPTSIRIHASNSITNEQAEEILTSFIDSPASTLSTNANAGDMVRNEAILNQLKRVQRDLRGLPPLARTAAELPKKNRSKSLNEKSEVEAIEGGGVDVDMMDAEANMEPAVAPLLPDGTVDKEERKRLKKLRRAQEKKAKA
ncbi:hypothetical protein NADFUDRAFT_45681 [Nadsonia fulvescens var. elongata DSM 6958]|uniref:Uncharacterized protein n=1 Tax=Nadsonia fulvescens var. elongata DSM 6958 TaxID=857566 RepID=A0A1E3PRP4_9ASCO|nr:hypothetical protein NADFUDRAFT_45681 [Nadsonia fulvescens var. elongata DSM 6958]